MTQEVYSRSLRYIICAAWKNRSRARCNNSLLSVCHWTCLKRETWKTIESLCFVTLYVESCYVCCTVSPHECNRQCLAVGEQLLSQSWQMEWDYIVCAGFPLICYHALYSFSFFLSIVTYNISFSCDYGHRTYCRCCQLWCVYWACLSNVQPSLAHQVM